MRPIWDEGCEAFRPHQPLPSEVDSTVTTLEIIGVVGHVLHNGLHSDPRIEVFMPYAQVPHGSLTFVVETSTNPGSLLAPLKARVWDVDPTLPLYDVATLDSLVAQTLAPRRFVLHVVGTLSVLAFTLSAIGI